MTRAEVLILHLQIIHNAIKELRNNASISVEGPIIDDIITCWNSVSTVTNEPFIFKCESAIVPDCQIYTVNESQVCESCKRELKIDPKLIMQHILN
jgi:hypothetical protein